MAADFRERIEKELSGFSHRDVRRFTWLCAVRALPFLCSRGSFNSVISLPNVLSCLNRRA